MNIKIDRNILLSGLKTTCNVIDPISLTPSNDAVMMEVTTTNVKFKAFGNNAAAMFETSEGFECKEAGKAAIKGKIFYNIVSKIKSNQINLEVVDNSVLRISTEKFSSDINLFDENLFPTLNFQSETWKKVEIKNSFLKQIFTKLIPCATTTETKNIACNAILIDSTKKPGVIEATGTDGNHLAHLSTQYNGEQIKLIINTQTLKQLDGFLESPIIVLYINNKNVIFKSDKATILIKTIEGEYPNLSKPLQTQNPNKITVDLSVLVNAIDKAIVLAATDKKPTIQFNIDGGLLKITTRSIEYGSTFEEIEIQNTNNTAQSFTFNAKYLLDLLKNIDTKNVVLEFSTSHMPVIIKEENNTDYISLILPIMNL